MVGSFKGGRNESYKYGTDAKNDWYDYDLINAYTTALACATVPDTDGMILVTDR